MESTHRIEDILVITDRLIEILSKENETLRQQEFSKIRELLEEKATISRVYETKVLTLEENPDLLEKLNTSVKEQLMRQGREVKRLTDENGHLLTNAIEANRQVVNLIADAVRETSKKTDTYGSSGSNVPRGPRAEANSIALSLDQTL